MKTILYFISLVLLIAAFICIIEYGENQRMQLLAGILAPLGIVLNLAAFLMKKKSR